EGIGQQLAQGINLMYFIPTGIIALVVHIRNKNFEAKTALLIGGFGVVGAVIGSWVAMTLSGNSLRKMFGIFLLIIGIYEIYNGVKERKT
ncbi:MAG: sulfite exporter TauE/SafE family protein, partial [Oscillospiraceae bacterium]